MGLQVMDDQAKKVAVCAIKEKLHSLVDERNAIERQRLELDQRSRRIDIGIMDCRSAARLFGIELEIPEELALIRSIMAHRDARFHGGEMTVGRGQPPATAGRFVYNGPPLAAPVPAGPIGPPDQKSLFGASEPSVREIVLAYLKRALPQGTKASTLREFVEKVLKKKIHEKTVGMTLYRLSKDKPALVRRDGQTWYYSSTSALPVEEQKGSAVAAAEP
jgi:hypothetical protein